MSTSPSSVFTVLEQPEPDVTIEESRFTLASGQSHTATLTVAAPPPDE